MGTGTSRNDTDAALTEGWPSEITTRAELGEALTSLRSRSGLSLRELASRVDSSASTLSGWCRAENLPFPSQHEVFRRMLEELGVEDTDPWLDALARVRDGVAPRATIEGSPYRGLESFTANDAERFFGRGDLTSRATELARTLQRATDRPRALVVVGASGSGKSSLVHAGLLPRLTQHHDQYRSIAPGSAPLERLVWAFHGGHDEPERTPDDPDLAARLMLLQEDPATWAASSAADDQAPAVLVVDQLEELFTQCDDDDVRDAFLAALEALADPARGGVLVIAALRIDLYGDLVATGRLAEALQTTQVLVGPMDSEQLVEAIVEPARRTGWSVDDDLVAVLLRDFLPAGSLAGHHQPGALPMLSYALQETWRRSRRSRMTVSDYHAAGGIHGAIEQAAESIYRTLDAHLQPVARDLFLRLVRLNDDGTLVARHAASFSELEGLAQLRAADGPDDPAPGRSTEVAAVLDRFVRARLLTVHRRTIELTHEALLTAWPRLASWIDENRDTLRLRRMIAEATRLWLDSGRDPSTLAAGVRLAALRAWTDGVSSTLLLSEVEREFVTRSLEAADEAEAAARRRTRRLRALVAVASVSALLTGVLAVVAGAARSDAIAARDEALSRQVALTADRLRDTDPALAAQLAIVGHDISPTGEARSVLLDTAIAALPQRYLGGPGTTAIAMPSDRGVAAIGDSADGSVQLFRASGQALERAGRFHLDDPDAEIYAMAMAPNEQVLAVGDTTASIALWDISDPDAPARLAGPLHGPEGPIQGLAFDPTGSEVAAVGLGDGVFRWDISDPTTPRPLPLLPSDTITWSVAYDADGQQLATGTEAGEIVVWDLTTGPDVVHTLKAGERSVLSVGFSPDGGTLAAGSRDAQLRIWDLRTAEEPSPIEIPEATFGSWVNALRFSPDGRYLAAGSSDTEVRLWDVGSWHHLQTLPHAAAITDIAFTANGGALVTAATNGAAHRWDVARSIPVQVDGAVWGIAVDDAGDRFAAFSGREAVLWSLDGSLVNVLHRLETPADGPGFSGGGAISPDGSLLALGTLSGEVWLAELDAGGRAILIEPPLDGGTALVEELAFSADGGLLAAGGRDTDVHLWDVSDPRHARRLGTATAPTEIVLSVAISPTSPVLAAASADNATYLHDLSDPHDPRLLARLDGFESDVYTAAFSPDGRTLAVAGSDATVVLWDVSEPASPRQLGGPITGPTGRVFAVAFDAQGERLAAAVGDGTTWVWNVTEPETPVHELMLDPKAGQAFAARWAPDGSALVGSGGHGRLWVWPIDEPAAVARICSDTADPVTTDEWSRYLVDRPYDPPC